MIQRKKLSYLLLITSLFLCLNASAQEEKAGNQIMNFQFNDAPTYIQSQRLSLFSEKKVLRYDGDVHVLHDGMNLSSDTLEAFYSDSNEIIRLVATNNVYITKGATIRARSNKAVYEKTTAIVTLTENPELQQEKSILAADIIKIYMNEDKSEAEGDVRVKVLEAGENKRKGKEELPKTSLNR